VHTIDGEVYNMEGDPDQPSTQGGLCPKGSAQLNIRNIIDPDTGELKANPARARHALYRAPGATSFTKVDTHWALKEIAMRIYNSREAGFKVKDENGVTVNRTENIGWIGFASADNEECQLIVKLARGLGLTFFDHQARI
ncbi:MAG: formate dehydrogenase, partial [Coriobacteriia bacterium]|nr:formate dehydrogenase [Coriobacteriia bacterium]